MGGEGAYYNTDFCDVTDGLGDGVVDVAVVHEDRNQIGVGCVDIAAPELARTDLSVLAGHVVCWDADLWREKAQNARRDE